MAHARKMCMRYRTLRIDHARKGVIIASALKGLHRVEWESFFSRVRRVCEGLHGSEIMISDRRKRLLMMCTSWA